MWMAPFTQNVKELVKLTPFSFNVKDKGFGEQKRFKNLDQLSRGNETAFQNNKAFHFFTFIFLAEKKIQID